MSVTLSARTAQPAAPPPGAPGALSSQAERAWHTYAKALLKENKSAIRAHCAAQPPSWRRTARAVLHAFMVLDGWRNPIAWVAQEQHGLARHHVPDPVLDAKQDYCHAIAEVKKATHPPGPVLRRMRADRVREFRAVQELTHHYCWHANRAATTEMIDVATAFAAPVFRVGRVLLMGHDDLYERLGTLGIILTDIEDIWQKKANDLDKAGFCRAFRYDAVMLQERLNRPASHDPVADLRQFGIAADQPGDQAAG